MWKATSAISAGSVNTTWKYPTGSRSASRSASHVAVLAGLDVTAESRGAAILDSRHDLELGEAEVPGMGGPERRACNVEDVGDLDRGAHAQPSGEISAGLNSPSLSSGLVTVRTVLVATFA